MDIKLTRRYELKFRCSKHEFFNFYEWIHSSLAFLRSSYSDRAVNSIYYDTVMNNSLEECRSDAVNKKKVRLRWYNKDLGKARLEVKYKYGLVNEKDVYPFLKTENQSIQDLIVNCKLEYGDDLSVSSFLDNHRFIVSYDREYFEAYNPEYTGLRVTIDTNVKYQQINPFGSLGVIVPEVDDIIMEIKFPISIYDSVAPLIRSLNSELSRNSKFANACQFA